MSYKRIMMSVAMIIVAGVVVAGATGAFYSDTETSENNIFTAGSIDLKVDHLKQTYNGEDCTFQCDTWAEDVVSFDQGDKNDGSDVLAGRSNPDEALGPADTSGGTPDSSPSGFVSLGFGGSIVLHFPDGIDDGPGDDIRIWEGTGNTSPAYPNEDVKVEVSPNGSDWTTIEVDPNEITFDDQVALDADIDEAASVVYYVRLTDITDSSIHDDDADGYDLDAVEALHCDNEETDGQASDAWQCQLWEETDLTNESFFNFLDIKPGDRGSNVISLHVSDNDAYSCLLAHDGDDQENGVMESEGDDDESAGELQNYINVFAWSDNDADGFYEPGDGETSLGTSTLGDLGSIASLDGDNFLTATSTEYIGLEWCAGDISEDDGQISCDGAGMLNDAQSDSFSSSLTAYAVQTRNNDNFSCDAVDLDEEENGQDVTFQLTEDSEDNNPDEPVPGAEEHDQPYVTWDINGDEIEFTFHNPTPWLFVFDVQVDGEDGDPRPGGLTSLEISEGPLAGEDFGETYQRVEVDGSATSSVTQTFSGSDEIRVGLREGAEQHAYFDWLTFEAN